jgi:hypothetical protein
MGLCVFQAGHASIPFSPGYFGDKFLLFAQTGLEHIPPILYFPPEARCIPLHLTFFPLRWASHELLFSKLALNHHPPALSLSSSWDYRCEPLVPVIRTFEDAQTLALN